MGITTVAGVAVQAQHRASCHCGTVELLLELPEGIVDPRRCDCSMCRRRGAIAASVAREGLQIVRGQTHLRLYQFNTHVAEHYFCGICGIYTHHRRRSNPDQYGYNVACLEGIDPFALGTIPVNDGCRLRRGGAIFCHGAMLVRPTRNGRFNGVRRTGVSVAGGSVSAGIPERGGLSRSSNHMAGLRGGRGRSTLPMLRPRPGEGAAAGR
uniref:CENP-V/GFA domain-containing protein n=1 Tax=Knufia peltigerae TaxID=1002370 RepID=A0AA39CW76_9EURO|nr:hypothetical protein H2204_009124 [Knufia peltigerae]